MIYWNIYALTWLQLRGLSLLNGQSHLLFLIGTTPSVLLVLSLTIGIRLLVPWVSFWSSGLCQLDLNHGQV